MLKKIIAAVKGISEVRAWQKEFAGKAPKAGTRAPDFELSDVNGENPIRLSHFFGQRPIVLVFGSFS
jgi:peroxiredoxin